MSVAARIHWGLNDALTLIGRSLRHTTRNLDALLLSVALPVLLLLLFVYVFGGAIDTRAAYVNYVVPGIILLCTGYGASTTAVSVANDMATGVIDRFRTLPILSSAVLTGHVVASLARNLLATTLVVGVALAAGFRPTAGFAQWLAALGVLLLFILAMSWAAVALGLLARSVEGASGFTFFILFLPYLSSAFVPTDTMPEALRVIAANQPVTPVIETLRGLLLGRPVGNHAGLAVAWFTGLLVVAYAASAYLFRRRTAR